MVATTEDRDGIDRARWREKDECSDSMNEAGGRNKEKLIARRHVPPTKK